MILYKYSDSNGVQGILKTQTIFMKNPNEFNDPFDCTLPNFSLQEKTLRKIIIKQLKKNDQKVPKNEIKGLLNSLSALINEAEIDLRQNWDDLVSQYRMVCLTKKNKDILMWSHYADSHYGGVIGFDFPPNEFKEIKYYSTRSKVIDKIFNVIIATFIKKEGDMNDNQDQDNIISSLFLIHLIKTLYVKKDNWEYEEEYRKIEPKAKVPSDVLNFNKAQVKEIILGLRMKEIEKNEIIQIAIDEYPHAKLFQASKEKDRIEINEILL